MLLLLGSSLGGAGLQRANVYKALTSGAHYFTSSVVISPYDKSGQLLLFSLTEDLTYARSCVLSPMVMVNMAFPSNSALRNVPCQLAEKWLGPFKKSGTEAYRRVNTYISFLTYVKTGVLECTVSPDPFDSSAMQSGVTHILSDSQFMCLGGTLALVAKFENEMANFVPDKKGRIIFSDAAISRVSAGTLSEGVPKLQVTGRQTNAR
ncbi:hypothetical protein BTVI_132250 [Pitangus sulphuratus]|nr:hypothetical protein BTVI_132250 [Pitangus sulphuratus]